MKPDLRIADYTYDLPEERIAKFPLARREDSKLLLWHEGQITDHVFSEVPKLLPTNSLLVFNNTRVVQARLLFEKTAGAKPIEVFCLEAVEQDVQQAMAASGEVVFACLVGNAKRWNDDLTLTLQLPDGTVLHAKKEGRKADTFFIRFSWHAQLTFAEVLDMVGRMPLPPYLHRASTDADVERYQTVYARHNGSVAAPTAGLHFTTEVLDNLRQRGVQLAETTLHVGAGTFKPVTTQHVADHEMHAEEIHVQRDFIAHLLQHQGPVISVGTTSTRTLESLYWLGVKAKMQFLLETTTFGQWEAYDLPQNVPLAEAFEALLRYMQKKHLDKWITRTSLLIAPGYKFRVIDGFFTNFHQPGSTLMLLVAAALGKQWQEVYAHALATGYRFLSYGDSNLYHIPPQNRIPRN